MRPAVAPWDAASAEAALLAGMLDMSARQSIRSADRARALHSAEALADENAGELSDA
jgi:hypothetical protein